METFVIDPRGDLWVTVEGTNSWGRKSHATFRVCSRTLARASPVFDAMLFGPFVESRCAEQDDLRWIVNLPDDPAPGMKSLFELMHAGFETLSNPFGDSKKSAEKDAFWAAFSDSLISPHRETELDIVNQVYDLILVADKYNSTKLLKPWAKGWLSAIEELGPLKGQQLLRSTWIYYHIGHRKRYEKAATALVMGPPLDKEETPEALPPSLLDSVLTRRLVIIGYLTMSLEHYMTTLVDSWSSPVGYCCAVSTTTLTIGRKEQIDCEARMLGFLIRELKRRGLWPIPPPEEVDLDTESFCTLVDTLSTTTRRGQHVGDHRDCVVDLRCSIFFSSAVDGGLTTWQDSLECKYVADEEEVAHMARQRLLTGISMD
ncbi:hypothetical protein MN608_09421 [Microdochium nivale]|nr:hypothetical protein MN608_09421 [Microdochium nivale]